MQLDVAPDIHTDDFIFRFLVENPCFKSVDLAVRYYFHDGRESARKLSSLLHETDRPGNGSNRSVLEFASGYGCVTRHMKHELPDFRTVACDIHRAAVDFIESRLAAEAIPSCANPEDFRCPEQFDVVFALSFFSHMPRRTWGAWAHALFGALKSDGLLIFTTQGLNSAKYFGNPPIPADGFWYRADSEQKDLDVSEYGQTLVTEAFVRTEIAARLGQVVELYRAGYWWDHQDLYVVRKT